MGALGTAGRRAGKGIPQPPETEGNTGRWEGEEQKWDSGGIQGGRQKVLGRKKEGRWGRWGRRADVRNKGKAWQACWGTWRATQGTARQLQACPVRAKVRRVVGTQGRRHRLQNEGTSGKAWKVGQVSRW